MAICKLCGCSADNTNARIVVRDSDTNGHLRSWPIGTEPPDSYYALIDSCRYPNLTNPYIECKACDTAITKEIQEELDYYADKHYNESWR